MWIAWRWWVACQFGCGFCLGLVSGGGLLGVGLLSGGGLLGLGLDTNAFAFMLSSALFTGLASIDFNKFFFKIGPTALFTHLKIIFLQCF